ncbi:MAG TPA: TolC family protein, partial [Candidatus Wallbacteria bacterium]|nr:TolC family protein [Candidatus Wallbacteria bacterium]
GKPRLRRACLSGRADVTKYKQGVFSHNLGYERLYRSGTTISPSIAVSTSESNDPENRAPRTTEKVQFAITRPLGRDNNFQANAAAEKSSKIELESASLDSLYTISQTVHDVIQSYWSYAYSYKALKVAEESKIRSEKLYNDTKILVENDELAASELDQLAANLNQKIADCEKASQALLKARNDLKVAAGVPKDSPLISGPPADFFPADRLAGDSSETALMSETLTAFAMANRKDYAAAQKRLESFKFTIPAAKDALRPQADLQITAGYNSRKDDKGAAAIISSMHEGVPGANISATVSYSFPPGNRSARAAVIKQEEQFVQAKIKAEEISRKIGINIETRISAIVSIIGRYRRTLESCRLYAKALENEKEKHRMGVSTLLDVLNTEDSLGQSELSLESIVLEYANALADLRHEAGCMGRLGTSECEIKMDDLIALPEVKNLEK